MYSKVNSAVVHGIDGLCIEIEVKLSKGLPTYQIVGLPDKTVRESKERIRSAIESLSVSYPAKRMTLNLIPAETPKDGSHLDLPMAIGILSALGEIESSSIAGVAFFGELTLDGRLMPVPGILSMVVALKNKGVNLFVVPEELKSEVMLIEGISCFGASTLQEVFEMLRTQKPLEVFDSHSCELKYKKNDTRIIDFSDVIGQEMAKRALMISAAGFHNILVSGPPGSGKSMMFSAFQDILPSLSHSEAVEVRMIHSIRQLNTETELSLTRPVRKPHHNITTVAMTGGGVKPRPGELTLAHRGVLFLDELPEYSRATLEAMRQPLEDKEINLSRVNGQVKMPSRVLLAATMNPCKCGYLFSMDKACTCTEREVKSYLGRLSGPMLDRIDLLVEVQRVDICSTGLKSESTDVMADKVKKAVRTQCERFKHEGITFNSEMEGSHIKAYCNLSTEANKLLIDSVKQFLFSRRIQEKLMKISRTIADLEGAKIVEIHHMAEAIQYRMAESRFRRENL